MSSDLVPPGLTAHQSPRIFKSIPYASFSKSLHLLSVSWSSVSIQPHVEADTHGLGTVQQTGNLLDEKKIEYPTSHIIRTQNVST